MTPPVFARELSDQIRGLFREYPDYHMRFFITQWETSFLRFYHSQTNYNIDKLDCSLHAEIVRDRKKTSFTLTSPDEGKIRSAVQDAVSTLDRLPPDPDFVSFEDDPGQFDYPDCVDNLTDVSLDDKIAILQLLSALADKYGFDIFGIFVTLKDQTRILASNGMDKLSWQSPLMLEVKAVKRDNMVTVIDAYGGDSLSGLDQVAFLGRFEEKLKNACLPVTDMPAGEYEVILAPYALLEFLTYLGYGMSAASLDQGSSYFEGRLGQSVFPDSVSLDSDPLHPRLIRIPYNGDGHIAPRLPLVEKGVFRNFTVSHYYAHKMKMAKNGSVGVKALVMHPGTSSLEKMISGVKQGLYISNLHYMNFINEKETSVTGITRDGTFLIENGRITKVVNNLRYTLKISDVLDNIREIEDRQYVVPVSSNYNDFNLSSGLVPHIRTGGFRISSSTRTI